MRSDAVDMRKKSVDDHRSRRSSSWLRGVRLPHKVFWTARMSRSTDQIIGTGGVGTKVLFDVRDKDVGYDDGLQQTGSEICDLTNYNLVARQAGWWNVWAVVPFASSTGGTVRQGHINVDRGAGMNLLVGSKRTKTPVAGGSPTIIEIYLEDYFADGDKLELRGFQDTGANLNILTAEGILFGMSWKGL